MFAEVVRMVADALYDGTYGVNALLATVPREGSIALPAGVSVRDESRDPECARNQVPEDVEGNALLVSTAEDVNAPAPVNRPFPADLTVDVLVRFATSNPDTAEAICDASVTLRAVLRWAGLFMAPANEAARSRSGVQLLGISAIRLAPLYSVAKDVTVTGGAIISCRCRDLFAIGA